MTSSRAAGAFSGVLNSYEVKKKRKKIRLHTVKNTGSFFGSIIEAHTVIGADMAAFAFIDDRTFHQLFPPALVWAA